MCIAPTGGLLFEHFVVISGTEKVRRAWVKLNKACKRSRTKMNSEQFQQFLDADLPIGFYFFIMSTLRRRGTSAHVQLFYIGLLLKHKGLSRSGLDLVKSMGLCISNRGFDEREADELKRCQATTRS